MQYDHNMNTVMPLQTQFVFLKLIANGDLVHLFYQADLQQHPSEVTVDLLFSHCGQIGIDVEGVRIAKLLVLQFAQEVYLRALAEDANVLALARHFAHLAILLIVFGGYLFCVGPQLGKIVLVLLCRVVLQQRFFIFLLILGLIVFERDVVTTVYLLSPLSASAIFLDIVGFAARFVEDLCLLISFLRHLNYYYFLCIFNINR